MATKGNAKKGDTAIYDPPKPGFPFLVVTLAKDGVSAVPVSSRKDARGFIAEQWHKQDKHGRGREDRA